MKPFKLIKLKEDSFYEEEYTANEEDKIPQIIRALRPTLKFKKFGQII